MQTPTSFGKLALELFLPSAESYFHRTAYYVFRGMKPGIR
jgi:hypothetical protein